MIVSTRRRNQKGLCIEHLKENTALALVVSKPLRYVNHGYIIDWLTRITFEAERCKGSHLEKPAYD